MSRIGKQPIEIPNGVKVEIESQSIAIEGPKGKLNYNLPFHLNAEVKENQVIIKEVAGGEHAKALWGTWRSILNNAVLGVTSGYQKQLGLVGIGFRGAKKDGILELNVGFSHPVKYEPPKGVKVNCEKNIITVSGIDKQKVGEVAAQIRSIRPPEPYKGKGIRYVGEEIKLKPGKAAKAMGEVGK